MTYYISAKRFYFDHKVKEGGYLAVTDGRFGKWTENVPEGAEVLDYSDYQIAPGLVDTHIHGFAGYDVMDNSEESLLGMSQALLSAGVTSFLPTALTAPSVKIAVMLDKPSRRVADITPDFKCYEIEDKFVVGCGLDYDERYRNLPFIGIISE